MLFCKKNKFKIKGLTKKWLGYIILNIKLNILFYIQKYGGEIMSDANVMKLYEEREKRYIQAVSLEQPDRVPHETRFGE